MKGRQMAVCGREKGYAKKFAEFANSRKDSLFAVHGFTDWDELTAYTKEHPVDILLLSEEYRIQISEDMGLGRVILLTEEEYREDDGYPAIYKFQPCTQILRQVLDIYAEQAPQALGMALRKEGMKRLGIYSPVGRTGKTGFALALGKEVAKRRRTLYLNMEEYSGFAALYPYEDGWTLSELMYFLKQGKKAFACKLEGVIQQIGDLDYIPPLRSPVELRHISREDWEALLDALERESRYEVVILDLSGMVNGLFELLEECDCVYTPVEEDETARAKVSQYEDTLGLLELEHIMERTKKLCLSGGGGIEFLAKAESRRWSGE